MLKQFIDLLSKDLEIEQPLAPNEDGSYSLRLEPDLDIFLREISDSNISLLAPLAPLPDSKLDECLQYMMTANLLGRETGGSALGLTRDGKRAALLHFIPGSSTYREFHDILEDFVNYAESWRQEIVDFGKGEQSE